MKRTYGLNGTYAVPDWEKIRRIRSSMDIALGSVRHTQEIVNLREAEARALRRARSFNTRYDGSGSA